MFVYRSWASPTSLVLRQHRVRLVEEADPDEESIQET